MADLGVKLVMEGQDLVSPKLNKVAANAKKTDTAVKSMGDKTKDAGRSFGFMASSMSNVPLAGFVGQIGAATQSIQELQEAGMSAKMAITAGFAGIAAASIAAGVALGNAASTAIEKIRGIASALNEADRQMTQLIATTAKYRGWQLEDQQAEISETENIEERRQATEEFINEQKKLENEAAAEYRRLSEERKQMEDSFWVTDRERRMKANEERLNALQAEMDQREDARRRAEKDLEAAEKAKIKADEDQKKRDAEAERRKEEAARKDKERAAAVAEKKAEKLMAEAEKLQAEADEMAATKTTSRGGQMVTESRFLQTGQSLLDDPLVQATEKAEKTRQAQLKMQEAIAASLESIEANLQVSGTNFEAI